MTFMTELSTLEAMLVQDECHYSTEEYFATDSSLSDGDGDSSNNKSKSGDVTVADREKMVQLMFALQEHVGYPIEAVEITLSILDRYLLTSAGADALKSRQEFQLACIVAFYVSAKVHQEQPIAIEALETLAQGTYTREEMEIMERKMLPAISWRVNPPTSFALIREIVRLLPDKHVTEAQKNALLNIAEFQAQWTVGDYNYITVTKATIAFAAVINAMEGLNIPPEASMANLLGSDGFSSVQLAYQWTWVLPQVQCSLHWALTKCADYCNKFLVETEHTQSVPEHPTSPVTVIMDDARD